MKKSYKNENKFSPLFFYDFPWSENRFDNEINKISVIKNWFYDNGFQNEINEYFSSNYFCELFNSIFFDQSYYIIKDLLIFEKVLISTNPDQIIFSQSWDKSVRAMIYYAKKFSVTSHVFLHSSIITKDRYRNKVIDVDNYHAYNKSNYFNLINAGQNKSSITYFGGLLTKTLNNTINEVKSNSSIYPHKMFYSLFLY